MQITTDDNRSLDCEVVEDYMKWFEKADYGNKLGWKIKKFKKVCNACGSPFCMYDQNPIGLNKTIDKYVCVEGTPEARRLRCYQEGIRLHYKGRLGKGVRKRVGWCFESMVKTTFPNPNNEYTGFRRSEQDTDLHVASSSSGDMSPIIDLTK